MGSHPRSSNYCVCDGERAHTHLLHAYFSVAHTLCAYFAHSYACCAQAWLKGVCRAHVVISLSSHLLPTHVSPVLALAVPWRSLRDHSRLRPRRPHWRFCARDPAELPRPKSAGQVHSARGRGVWLPGQVRPQHRLWAQRVRQDHFRGWWHDAHQRSDFSKKHEREH